MNVLFRVLFGLSFALALPAAAQTNLPAAGNVSAQTNQYQLVLVTNWVQPWASLRVVAGQLYDVNRSQLWQWVNIPEGATVLDARFYGSVQPTDLTFTWTWQHHDGRLSQYCVNINNFPYDPALFRHAEGNHALIVTAEPLQLQLYPINVQTNWSPLGREYVGTSTYDYGTACTNLVPITSWQRVPITSATDAVAEAPAPPVVPQPTVPMATGSTPEVLNRDYFTGSLSNRLQLVLNLSNVSRRDGLLQMLAFDSARAGDAATTSEALYAIHNEFIHDNVAAATARILARQGFHAEALQIAGSIKNNSQRSLIVQTLTQ